MEACFFSGFVVVLVVVVFHFVVCVHFSALPKYGKKEGRKEIMGERKECIWGSIGKREGRKECRKGRRGGSRYNKLWREIGSPHHSSEDGIQNESGDHVASGMQT